jgi:hypothetical protein
MKSTSIVRAASVAAVLVAVVGCEQELGEAFENVRAAAPAVCKDYCEEKTACEWPKAEGPEEDAAFSSKIRQCTVNCAWYMSEGAYVVEYSAALEQTEYVGKVSGGVVKDTLGCVYDSGSYHCAENEDGPSSHVFEPRIEVQCETVAECVEALGIDFTFVWNSSGGGTCAPSGEQRIENPFF